MIVFFSSFKMPLLKNKASEESASLKVNGSPTFTTVSVHAESHVMIKKPHSAMVKKVAPVKKAPAKKSSIDKAMPIISSTHDNYQARDDMHTLKNAEHIKADPKRHHAAVHHAKAEVGALQKVARKKV